MVPRESAKTPLTTYFMSKWCQSNGPAVCTPGSYRLSLELRASIKSDTVGHKAVVPFREAISEPELIGKGAQKETWFCLRDLEQLYDGRFHRMTGKPSKSLNPLRASSHIIESLHPETRSVPSLPGILTLTSPQIYTLHLWVAVHRYILYLDDPANADVRNRPEQGRLVEKVFPKGLSPALTGEVLNRDAETRNFRGRAPSGHYVELKRHHWVP